MKKQATVILLIVVCYFLFSLFKKDSYLGFYYPDASNLMKDIESDGQFETLEQCRVWVNTQIQKFNKDNKDYDYECGKNCRMQNGMKPYICEETVE